MSEVAKILAHYSSPINRNSKKAELLLYAALLVFVLAIAA